MKLYLPSFLRKDQWLHIFVGIIIYAFIWIVAGFLDDRWFHSDLVFFKEIVALLVTMFAGLFREIQNQIGFKAKKTGFSFSDWMLTIAIPVIVTLVIMHFY